MDAPTFEDISSDLERQGKRLRSATAIADLKHELMNNVYPIMARLLQATAYRVDTLDAIVDQMADDEGGIPVELIEAIDGSLKIGLALCALLEKDEISDEEKKDIPNAIKAYRELAEKISESFEETDDEDE